MKPRLAVLLSHPIQHFAPWHREAAGRTDIDLRVFFYCDWGIKEYFDPDFGQPVQWDIPLLEGYQHQFLTLEQRPTQLDFSELDNPDLDAALDRFQPDVLNVFGYSYASCWRPLLWARRHNKPVVLHSDSAG